MLFFRNKHIMCDFGTGKKNFIERNKQDVINILEAVYRRATKGKGLVNSPEGAFDIQSLKDIDMLTVTDYSTRHRY